ncbi:MAG: tRNA-binding protein [Bdellovibrionaceae bacterium]|nr:tRNA-binding protein [Pseudobdellovibrionaceae bacterium]|tara:strand:+ start:1564 stop:1935 length:372 start_codon:yes stop_codon:yes gene_type:complete
MHLDFDPKTPSEPTISFESFLKIDIRVGEIIDAHSFPEARNPSFKLTIDFGEGVGIKKSSAQITTHYSTDSLIGKKILAVVNFKPRQIGPFLSEVLILGLSDENNAIVLGGWDHPVPNGARLH